MIKEICVISGIYPPESGGPAKFASTFANWIPKDKTKISIVTLTDHSSQLVETNGIEIRKISRKTNIIFRYLVTAFHIRQKMNRGSKIIANGCFIETWLAAKLTNYDYVAKVPGDIVWERASNKGGTSLSIQEFQDKKLNLKYKVFRYMYSASLRNATFVIVPTEELKIICIRWGVSPHKISVIYNSVAVDLFKPIIMPKKYDVITVSRLVAWKNIGEIIQVCCDLSLTLAIIGEGPEKLKLESLAKKIGANVKFLGNVLQKDLPVILNSAKIFILNSSYEASSYALLEARACGLITIAKSKTGSQEVIRDNIDGFLVDESIGGSLKKCLGKVYDKNFDYRRFSELAIERTNEDFNMSKNYEKIYNIVSGY